MDRVIIYLCHAKAVHEQFAAGSKRPVNVVPSLPAPKSGLACCSSLSELGTDVLPANANSRRDIRTTEEEGEERLWTT